MHPLDQAVSVLASVFPDIPYRELAELSLGDRDHYLLSLRASLFGNRLPAYCECTHCREPLEFSIRITDVLSDRLTQTSEFKRFWDEGQLEITYRLPNSLDVGSAISKGDPESAYQELLKRCIYCNRLNGELVEIDEIPEDLIEEIMQSIEEINSQSEIFLDLICPGCQNKFQMLFDIATYLWTELRTFSKKLLQDIHQLAFHYGWSEREILTMSRKRRQYYLEMIEA